MRNLSILFLQIFPSLLWDSLYRCWAHLPPSICLYLSYTVSPLRISSLCASLLEHELLLHLTSLWLGLSSVHSPANSISFNHCVAQTWYLYFVLVCNSLSCCHTYFNIFSLLFQWSVLLVFGFPFVATVLLRVLCSGDPACQCMLQKGPGQPWCQCIHAWRRHGQEPRAEIPRL